MIHELVIRRGKQFYEVKNREDNDSKWHTTKIPVEAPCEAPAACRWCEGFAGPNGIWMRFPIRFDKPYGKGIHTVPPPMGAHLVAFEWAELHPNQRLRLGWVLTDEEKQAGKQGIPWPEDV
jgi:hypothetical protein